MTRIKAWHGFAGIRLRILLGLMLCALRCAANPANNIDRNGKAFYVLSKDGHITLSTAPKEFDKMVRNNQIKFIKVPKDFMQKAQKNVKYKDRLKGGIIARRSADIYHVKGNGEKNF